MTDRNSQPKLPICPFSQIISFPSSHHHSFGTTWVPVLALCDHRRSSAPTPGALQPARTASSHGLDLLGRGLTRCAESNLFASIGAQNFMFLDKRMRWGLDRSPLHDTPICGCTRLMWRSHVAGSNYPRD